MNNLKNSYNREIKRLLKQSPLADEWVSLEKASNLSGLPKKTLESAAEHGLIKAKIWGSGYLKPNSIELNSVRAYKDFLFTHTLEVPYNFEVWVGPKTAAEMGAGLTIKLIKDLADTGIIPHKLDDTGKYKVDELYAAELFAYQIADGPYKGYNNGDWIVEDWKLEKQKKKA